MFVILKKEQEYKCSYATNIGIIHLSEEFVLLIRFFKVFSYRVNSHDANDHVRYCHHLASVIVSF